MSSVTEEANTSQEEVSVPIEGMTCASCVNRVEKRLNRIDGVEATVNFATHKAHVDDPELSGPDDFVDAIVDTGYLAVLPAEGGSSHGNDAHEGGGEMDHDEHDHMSHSVASVSTLRNRFIVSAALTVPLLLMAMVSSLQFDYWQWISLGLSTVVVFWGGYPFHRSALRSARHGVAQMDTLISLGTIAAWTWSLWALIFGTAGEIGMTMPFEVVPNRDAALDNLYFETAGVVTTLLLLGRYFEENAKSKAGDALRALLNLGAKEVSVLDDAGNESTIPVAELAVGQRFLVRPGEKVATDGVVLEGSSAVDESLVTGE